MENEEGIRCVACPIFDYNGAVVASVSIAGPTLRITKERLPELIYLLVECTSKISSDLGYLGNKD